MALPKFKKQTIQLVAGKLLLREAAARDMRALNEIINEPQVNRFVYIPAPVSLKSGLAHLRELKKSGANWIVAQLDGKTVGSVEIRPRSARESHVAGFGIAFSTKAQGSGVAGAALDKVFAYAKKSGVKIIFASCFEDNKRARKFYQKMRFREIAVMKGHLARGGKYFGSVLIEKRL